MTNERALPGNSVLTERIQARKRELGKELIILTHHYQRREIVQLGDFSGDSFELSRKAAADRDCRYIVFCGVHFMAESAAILAQPHQIVQIPNVSAGCSMAEMAETQTVNEAWSQLQAETGEGSITPVVYMNSDAELKAFSGRNEGIVCTSSNAAKAVKWAFGKKEKILFFPDQHLGRNVGFDLGLSPEQMIVWSPGKPLGGNTPESVRAARMILWDGHCLVHTRFTTDHIAKMRSEFPGAKIVVHPECPREIVSKADACGSTSYIVKYVQEAPAGSTIVIGTEINLVHRLAQEHPDKKIIDLYNSLCPNMFKINLSNLLQTLSRLGEMNVVSVPEEIKADAKLALDRMLAL
ncbi:MAG: quinolinate synthase NadA [Desulfobacteraceae bacterium]|nr:quinolinate synthase NadA [Desulfobacteraceae bacterium]